MTSTKLFRLIQATGIRPVHRTCGPLASAPSSCGLWAYPCQNTECECVCVYVHTCACMCVGFGVFFLLFVWLVGFYWSPPESSNGHRSPVVGALVSIPIQTSCCSWQP